MSTYSSLSVNPYSGQAVTSSTSTSQSSSSTSSKDDLLSEFRSLMTIMMMSSMSSMTGSSGLSSSSDDSGLSSMGTGMNMNQLMLPLMLNLFEKLIAQQVETEPEAEAVAEVAQDTPQGSPVKGAGLTQGSRAGHVALDFGVSVGTNVKSTMDGKVVYAGWNNEGYGNLVIVENGPYRTYYAHLSEIPVEVGQKVQAGKVIGLSGNTGNSTGPHLHYEVRKDGVAINPTGFTVA